MQEQEQSAITVRQAIARDTPRDIGVLLGAERIVKLYNAYLVDEEKHIRLVITVITISKSLL